MIRRLRNALSHSDRQALARHAGHAPDWMRPVIAQIAGGLFIVKRPLQPPHPEPSPWPATPAARIGMMWQLALDAWAFEGESVRESRLPRHLVRVRRGGR